MGSQRLPGKVLLPLGGETLLARVWRHTCCAFGEGRTVIAYPDTDENIPLADEIQRLGARGFGWAGPEHDLLGRFYHCAHSYLWRGDSVIIRVTADDPFHRPEIMRRVSNGERWPVQWGGEAFTLDHLDMVCGAVNLAEANMETTECTPAYIANRREHLTYSLFPTLPPEPPPGVWSIDTLADLERARELLADRSK